MSSLVDTFGRIHDNLRISVTDRCNIRCFYCMPETNVEFLPPAELLDFEEILRVVRTAVPLGIRKIRLTGGEPLMRKDLALLVRELSGIDGIEDIALTTNGVLLAAQAESLFRAGLRRLNIHLDTLDRERFREIARRDDLERVLAAIDVAQRTGFDPIKINAVAVKNRNEPDLVPLARFGRERGFEVRYIEFMPLDHQGLWQRGSVLSAREIREILSREIAPLEEIPGKDIHAPASEYRFADGIGRVGFIASVSQPFCLNCNRLRLTSDGKLRYCLFATEETDIKALLRRGCPDGSLAAAIHRCVERKWIGHEINSPQFIAPARPMYSIGG